MKTSHHCPKCNSIEIAKIEGPATVGYSSNVVPAKGWSLSGLPVDRYVCISCGFTEEWIHKRKDLDRIKDKFGTNDSEQFV